MIQPKIQTVYTEIDISSKKQIEDCVELSGYFKEESLITFTPEEFETFKREFGKELLEKAADNSKLYIHHTKTSDKFDIDKEYYDGYQGVDIKVDKESITSVLDEYLIK